MDEKDTEQLDEAGNETMDEKDVENVEEKGEEAVLHEEEGELEKFNLDEESDEADQELREEEGDREMPDMSDLMPPTDVMSLSHLFISMLTNSTWQHLGLIPDPKTKEIEMDLKQAGLAIDIIEFLFGKLRLEMEKEVASGIEDLLANLRINYVKKSSP